MRHLPDDHEISNHIDSLVISRDCSTGLQGLLLLFEKINDYGVLLSAGRKQVLHNHIELMMRPLKEQDKYRKHAELVLQGSKG